MNSEKLKPFLIPILLLVATLGGAIYLGSQISTNVQSYMAVKEEVAQKQATVEEKTQKLEEYKKLKKLRTRQAVSLSTSQ